MLDGWWIEGYFEGVTGWAIGHDGALDDRGCVGRGRFLYDNARARQIVPMFYQRPARICGGDAFGDRAQRVVLQHAADAGAI